MALSRIGIGSLALALSATGCSRLIDYDTPSGFARAEMDEDWRSRRYKASDKTGLKLTVFDNVEGGTLDYWGRDLVTKLEERSYRFEGSALLRSENGVPGQRFDFALEATDDKPAMFLVVGLFVTDDYRYVLQLAGDARGHEGYDAQVPKLFGRLRPSGCNARDSLCKRTTRVARAQTR